MALVSIEIKNPINIGKTNMMKSLKVTSSIPRSIFTPDYFLYNKQVQRGIIINDNNIEVISHVVHIFEFPPSFYIISLVIPRVGK